MFSSLLHLCSTHSHAHMLSTFMTTLILETPSGNSDLFWRTAMPSHSQVIFSCIQTYLPL